MPTATSVPAWISQLQGAPAPQAAAPDMPAWITQFETGKGLTPTASPKPGGMGTAPAGFDPYSPASQGIAQKAIAARSPGQKPSLMALPEAALSMGTGTLGAIVGGYAGLGDAVARLFTKKAPLPGDVVSNVAGAMTYQPRTAGGRSLMNLAGLPARVADMAGDKVSKVTGSPALGAYANTTIQTLPMLLGSKAPEVADVAPEASTIPQAVAKARALGLKLTPQEANIPGGTIGRTLQSLTNGAKLERSISRKNAPLVTAQAARDVGIKGPVTAASIDAAYAPHNAVYDQVNAIGPIKTDATYQSAIREQQAPGEGSFPKDVKPAVAALREAYDVPQFSSADAIARIRQLRKEGNARVYGGKYDPDNAALGHAQLSTAKALEDQIDRHLTASAQSGTPEAVAAKDLIPQYRNARTQMARLASFERAWKAGNEQQVSGANLGKQLTKNVPLSGPTRTIAESANEFPRAFQDISKLRNEGPLSNIDFKLEGGLGAIHLAAAAKAAPFLLASPLARAILASDAYQRMAFGPRSAAKAPSFPVLGRVGKTLPILAAGQNQSPLAALLAGR